jgi:hypothetical protein
MDPSRLGERVPAHGVIFCPTFQLSSTIAAVKNQKCQIKEGDRMTGFVMRKNHRLKKLVPVRYLGEGIAGEGIIKDLSLSGSYITGNILVSVGVGLALQIFVPGDPVPLLIDRAIVKWVKGSEFGVDFDTPPPEIAERITKVISTLVKKDYGSPRRSA